MIKIGLAESINRPQADESPVEYLDRSLEVVRAARDAGFHYVRAGHHWLAGFLDPFAVFARAVPESGEMELHTSVFLLPQHNPFDIAERVATLDFLSKGRFRFGVGLGYRELEFQAAGMPKSQRVGRLVESIEIMRRLWSGEELTYQGRYFQITGGQSTFRPVQQPGPKIYIGGMHPNAVRRAGVIGDGWMALAAYTREDFREHLAIYREGRRNAGKTGDGDILLNRQVHLAATKGQAMEEAETYMPGIWNSEFYRGGGMQQDLGEAFKFELSWEELASERAVIGTPDDVVVGLQRYIDEFALTHLSLSMRPPGTTHEAYLALIRQVGLEVIPNLRSAHGD